MKTAREYLKEALTPELYDKADLYLELYPMYNPEWVNSVQDAIDAFEWDETDEGFEFWSEIFNSYEDKK